MPIIELLDITRAYRSGETDVPVLKGISISIESGEYVAIMGASGSGKSTLMNLIGCLDRPTSGGYLLNGEDVSAFDPDRFAAVRRHTFGFVFQRYNLISWLTATENVEVPSIYAGTAKPARREKAHELLVSLGLGERLDYRPNQLSGGQQQRVSIARALMNGGQVIMADEPSGALDSKSGEEVMDILQKLHEQGQTIIMVTHDPLLAQRADRIIRIADGEIVGDESKHIFNRAALPKSGQSEKGAGFLDIVEAFKMAMHSLIINKLRTLLTMLGIIIGVGSVVAMLAIGNGAKQEVLNKIRAMGTNLLLVRPGAPGVRGAGGTIATLVPEDAAAIRMLPGVSAAVPEMIQPVTVRQGNRDFATTVTATSDEFPQARNWTARVGVFFNRNDMASYTQVAVMGQTVADAIFPDGGDPIGKYILMGNAPFQVIGIMSAKGADPGGNDMDNMVWVPLTTGSIRLFGQKHLRSISVQASNAETLGSVSDSVKQLLLKLHGKEDSQVKSMEALIASATETQDTLSYLLGAIAAISLLVGGIGVMNIMLVSVTERTREIGVRVAVGARGFDIMLQFLTEAVVVCLVSGIIGVAVGVGGGIAASNAMGWMALFSPWAILLAFACAVATGLVFGYLPAKKAASLDPVVALATD